MTNKNLIDLVSYIEFFRESPLRTTRREEDHGFLKEDNKMPTDSTHNMTYMVLIASDSLTTRSKIIVSIFRKLIKDLGFLVVRYSAKDDDETYLPFPNTGTYQNKSQFSNDIKTYNLHI